MRSVTLAIALGFFASMSCLASAQDEGGCRTLAGEPFPCPSTPQPATEPKQRHIFSVKNVALIRGTYEANQMRFARDFKGQSFAGDMPFKSATENLIVKGVYRIALGTNNFTGDVSCDFSNEADLQRMSDWNPGDIINVYGVIKDVTFGTIELDECHMSKT